MSEQPKQRPDHAVAATLVLGDPARADDMPTAVGVEETVTPGAGHPDVVPTIVSERTPRTRVESGTHVIPRADGGTRVERATRVETVFPAKRHRDPVTKVETDRDVRRREKPAKVADSFYRLPEVLAERYEILDELGSGGQGVVLRCWDSLAEREVAVKLINRGVDGRPPELLAQLRDCSSAHVTPILDADPQGRWEVQEYFPVGTLNHVPVTYWTQERLVDFVRQAHAALTHVHSRQILHQDLKPANIFVRTLEPLDIVLGDFGLARQQELTEQVSSTDGTLAYQSPEYALAGRHSAGGDWWALGMIIHILVTGRHVYADGHGRIDSRALRAHLFDGDLAIDHVPDPRWRCLLEGLLTRELRERWGSVEVGEWLRGGNPTVHRPTQRERAARTRTITLLQKVCDTPEDVAAALASDEEAALRYLRSPDADDLLHWLARHGIGDDAVEFVAAIRANNRATRAFVALQAILDPETSPRIHGRELSATALLTVAEAAAGGGGSAANWINAMRTERVLTGAAQVETHSGLALVDDLLRSWWGDVDSRLGRLPHGLVQVPQRVALEGLVLLAALSETRRASLLTEGDVQRRRSADLPDVIRQAFQSRSNRDVVGPLLALVLVPEIEHRERAVAAERERITKQVASLSADAERKRVRQVRRTTRAERRRDDLARFRSRLGWHGLAAGLSMVGVGIAGNWQPIAFVAAWLVVATALLVVDLVTNQGRARLPRVLGWPIAATTVAYAAGEGLYGLTEVALGAPAGYLVGYTLGAVVGRIMEPLRPAAGRSWRVGSLVGLVPASVATAFLAERISQLQVSYASLPQTWREVIDPFINAIPDFDVPGPNLLWLGLPVAICLVWGLIPETWSRLGRARSPLASVAVVLSVLAGLADPHLLALGLVASPALHLAALALGAWRPTWRGVIVQPASVPLAA